jgi:hypothetical protein
MYHTHIDIQFKLERLHLHALYKRSCYHKLHAMTDDHVGASIHAASFNTGTVFNS